MDYATVHRLIEANGYKKVTTEGVLTRFKTSYLKNNDIINIKWEMGGYVKEVILTNKNNDTICKNAKQFIKEFNN